MSKILYLSPVSFIGGAEESLCTFLKFLDKDRFEPLVVLPSHGPLGRRLLKENVRVKIISPGYATSLLSRKSLFSLFFLPLAIPEIFIFSNRLRYLVKKEDIDIIHSNGLKCHFLGAVLASLAKKKIIWHIREIYNLPVRVALRFFRSFSDAGIIAISRAVKKSLNFTSPELIYNGVDTTFFYPFSPEKDLRKEIGFSKGKRLITIIGILTPWKGQHVFIEAIAKLRDTFPDLGALIVGKELYTGIGHRGYFSYLKDKVKKLGIENQVRFLGFRHDIPYIINSSRAIVHASLKPEPFGRVLIEAMACGKAVIAARGGAVDEIVRDGVDGFIVERNNPVALAGAISMVVENDDMAENMGKKGRERIEKLFTAERMARKVEKFYLKFR